MRLINLMVNILYRKNGYPILIFLSKTGLEVQATLINITFFLISMVRLFIKRHMYAQ